MFNEMIRKYSYEYNPKLVKLLQPFQDHLAIKHFCYYQITTSGHYQFIGSNLPFTEYFCSEKLYQDCPYLRHVDNYQSGVSLSKCIPESNFQTVLNTISTKYDMNLGLTIIEKNSSGIQGFVFASNATTPYLDTLYLNELRLFRLFIRRFKEEFEPVLVKMENDFIDLGSVVGKSFLIKNTNVVAKVQDRKRMLKQMGVDLPFHLTETEKEIVKEISRGQTSKEIGSNLYLSKRTVEHYVEKLKEEFHCSSKSELVKKTQELLSLGYFDN